MNQNLPFILNPDEKLIIDSSLAGYTGMKIENMGFFGMGITGSGLGGGLTTSTQHKTEGNILDSRRVHIYLTNKRFIAAIAKQNFLGTEEHSVGTVHSDIALQSIVGIMAQPYMLLGTKVGEAIELSVKAPSGDVDNITISFVTRHRALRTDERDNWIRLIREQIEINRKVIQKPSDSEDPVNIVKMRYAKGEITAEQYNEMLEILNKK